VRALARVIVGVQVIVRVPHREILARTPRGAARS
jgi:hypothetical protein